MFADYMFNKVAPAATCFAYLLDGTYTQEELSGLNHQQVIESGKVLAWGTINCTEFGFIGERRKTSAYGISYRLALDLVCSLSTRLRSGKIGSCLVSTADAGAVFLRSIIFDASDMALSRTYISVEDNTLDIVFASGHKPTVA